MSEIENTEEKTYPGVELVYPFAVQSYDIALNRFDAWDGRIQTLLSLYITVSLAIPVAGSSLKRELWSFWFFVISLAFAGMLISGIWGRLYGKLKMVDPSQLYKGFLHFSEWEFKKEFICWSAENYPTNIACLNRKQRFAISMTICFIAEIIFSALWIFLP